MAIPPERLGNEVLKEVCTEAHRQADTRAHQGLTIEPTRVRARVPDVAPFPRCGAPEFHEFPGDLSADRAAQGTTCKSPGNVLQSCWSTINPILDERSGGSAATAAEGDKHNAARGCASRSSYLTPRTARLPIAD